MNQQNVMNQVADDHSHNDEMAMTRTNHNKRVAMISSLYSPAIVDQPLTASSDSTWVNIRPITMANTTTTITTGSNVILFEGVWISVFLSFFSVVSKLSISGRHRGRRICRMGMQAGR